MQTSARNQFAGRVVGIKQGPINSEVTLEVGGGDHITALITTESASTLGIGEGAEVYALIKASSILLASGSDKLKLSARNQLPGTVLSCKQGSINAEVTLQLQGGKTLTAIITTGSVQRLGLKEGQPALAIFKVSSVILGIGS
jgi:molybdate transport system regulatory protein